MFHCLHIVSFSFCWHAHANNKFLSRSNMHLKSKYLKVALIIFLSIFLPWKIFHRTTIVQTTSTTTTVTLKSNDTRLNAFILAAACDSRRFNATKENIEDAFPKLFRIHCFRTIPLNDSRVHTAKLRSWKQLSTNLLAFVQLWTYVIPSYSKGNPHQWSFIFEDDVNFLNASRFFLPNYIEALHQLMDHPQIKYHDGFFYLGTCGPEYLNKTPIITVKNTNGTLLCKKGYAFCLHASAITPKRSRLFWSDIASYRPGNSDLSLDHQLRSYSIRSGNHFYILGSNFEFPPLEEHYGIAYQDRGRFISTVSENE